MDMKTVSAIVCALSMVLLSSSAHVDHDDHHPGMHHHVEQNDNLAESTYISMETTEETETTTTPTNAASATATNPTIRTTTTSTSTTTPIPPTTTTETPQKPSTSGGLSRVTKVIIGVGAGFVGLVIVFGVAYGLIKRNELNLRRQKMDRHMLLDRHDSEEPTFGRLEVEIPSSDPAFPRYNR